MLEKNNMRSQLFSFSKIFIIGIIKSQLDVRDNLNESILGGESEKRGGVREKGRYGDKTPWEG